ncbi:PEP-CTERM sorting domain-containing protein [Hahella sp. HN01]|uniref:PEP-CTERM sorting domain-containing protein n=1 Tax=unclassified Hahella TaxID=2624107 RepID=UPI001C1ED8AF|nr:PEP-CTERM sorting domain-containing protein [Hahella sp. HN01]MBU6951652.1 PEP-CTERM sorting domain-containing protein [Hahella sp. HN01]
MLLFINFVIYKGKHKFANGSFSRAIFFMNFHTGGVKVKTSNNSLLFSSIVLVACASTSQAALIEWNGAEGSDFNNAANWSGGVTPGVTDTAQFTTDGSHAELSDNASVGELSADVGRATVDLDGNNLDAERGVTVKSQLTIKNGKFNETVGDSGPPKIIAVGNDNISDSSLVFDNVSFGDNFTNQGSLQYEIGTSGAGALRLENGTSAVGQSAMIGKNGELSLSGGSSLSLANELYGNGGRITIKEGSRVTATGASVANTKVLVDGEGSSFEMGPNGSLGTAKFQNGGKGQGWGVSLGDVTIDGAGSSFTSEGVSDVGKLEVRNHGELIADNLNLSRESRITLGEGKITTASLDLNGGELSGSGEIKGSLNNTRGGVVSTGEFGGSMRVEGDYTQDESSKLEITLGDWSTLGGYELNIDGVANLDGVLQINLWDEFKPSIHDFFTLINADKINGMFSDFVLPDLGFGMHWDWGYRRSYSGVNSFGLRIVSNASGKPVPEPYVLVLMTLSLAGMAGVRRFRK